MNAHFAKTEPVPDLLGLNSVLVGSLPATLMTPDAPDRYTVEAVFTRKADRAEIAAIQGHETRARLSAHGFPTVELRVTDRRLEMANTNLEELRDGLATVIADLLAQISIALIAEREIAAHRLHDASDREQARAAAVACLAESVVFERRPAAVVDDEWYISGGIDGCGSALG